MPDTMTEAAPPERLRWLLMHNTDMAPMGLRVVQRPEPSAGLWDVALILDGGYTRRQDALGVMADVWSRDLAEVVAWVQRHR